MNKNLSYIKLAEENNYQTSFGKDFSPPKFPSISFYYKLTRIIYYASTLVEKGIYNDDAWIKSSYDIFRALESVGVEINISGMDNLRSLSDSAVFVSNHMSSLETMVYASIIHPFNRMCFIMKKELVDFPIFGKVSGAREPILVGRNNPRKDLEAVLKEGKKRLESGKSIVVFPQKTRCKFLEKKSFNTLGIKLAKSSNKTVVPIAIVSDAWTNGKILKDFGKIIPTRKVMIAFGKPLQITGKGDKEHEEATNFIIEKFKKWERTDLLSS